MTSNPPSLRARRHSDTSTPSPNPQPRPNTSFIPRPTSTNFLLLLLLTATLLLVHRLSAPPPSLTVLTLTYDESENPLPPLHITHNCLQIAPTRHLYHIHTDNPTAPYCTHCLCIPFVKRNCPCPERSPTACARKNLCEKLHFLIHALKTYREFVFLDNDLIILRREFLDVLQPRTATHDFLATYGHNLHNSSLYFRHFNSGLIFIRYVAGLHYAEMVHKMYEKGTQNDQGLISDFVQKYYTNWDSLSWKWHCRKLKKNGLDIPIRDCYTLHDRAESDQILNELNMSLLTFHR